MFIEGPGGKEWEAMENRHSLRGHIARHTPSARAPRRQTLGVTVRMVPLLEKGLNCVG